MSLLPREVQDLEEEQELLRGMLGAARRCSGRLPLELLDAVLSGARAQVPQLPAQRLRPPG